MRFSFFGPVEQFDKHYAELETLTAAALAIVYRYQCSDPFYVQAHADVLARRAGQYVFQSGQFDQYLPSSLVVEAIHTEWSWWQVLRMRWLYRTTDLAERDDFAAYLTLALMRCHYSRKHNPNVWIRFHPGASATGWADLEKWKIDEGAAASVRDIVSQVRHKNMAAGDAYPKLFALYQKAKS